MTLEVKLTLDQDQIVNAIGKYLESNGFAVNGAAVSINLMPDGSVVAEVEVKRE